MKNTKMTAESFVFLFHKSSGKTCKIVLKLSFHILCFLKTIESLTQNYTGRWSWNTINRTYLHFSYILICAFRLAVWMCLRAMWEHSGKCHWMLLCAAMWSFVNIYMNSSLLMQINAILNIQYVSLCNLSLKVFLFPIIMLYINLLWSY